MNLETESNDSSQVLENDSLFLQLGDMIEIKLTDNDVIYINFEYKGIPLDIPIEAIEIILKYQNWII